MRLELHVPSAANTRSSTSSCRGASPAGNSASMRDDRAVSDCKETMSDSSSRSWCRASDGCAVLTIPVSSNGPLIFSITSGTVTPAKFILELKLRLVYEPAISTLPSRVPVSGGIFVMLLLRVSSEGRSMARLILSGASIRRFSIGVPLNAKLTGSSTPAVRTRRAPCSK